MQTFESRVCVAANCSMLNVIVHPLLSNKAVADGAVYSYVDPLVTSRTSRSTYGIEIGRPYIPSLSDHQERAHTRFTVPSGTIVLPNGFQSILTKVCTIYRLMLFFIQFSDRVFKFWSSKNFATRFSDSRIHALN